jgi:sulfate transporter 4
LWKVNKVDLLMWLAAFLGTTFLGIQIGVLVAAGLSLFVVLFVASRPHLAYLGRLPGSRIFKNVKRFPTAKIVRGIGAVRMDAQLYFGNARYFSELVRRMEKKERCARVAAPVAMLVV